MKFSLPSVAALALVLAGCTAQVCPPGYRCEAKIEPAGDRSVTSAPLLAPAPQAQEPATRPTPTPAPQVAPPAPAPRAQAGQRATARVAGMDIVEMVPGSGQYCPVQSLDGRSFTRIWGKARAGMHPYAGTDNKAINGFPGISASAKQQILKLVEAGTYTVESFKEGDVFCGMWWTAGQVDYLMPAGKVGGWVKTPGVDTSYKAYVIDYGEFELVVKNPALCTNWNPVFRKKQAAAVQPQPAPPAPAASARSAPTPSVETYELFVQVLNWETVPQTLREKISDIMSRESDKTAPEQDGRVSADLGPELQRLLREGVIKGVSGRVTAEILYPDDKWMGVFAEPSTRYPGRTYFFKNVLRGRAAAEDSNFRARNFRSAGCEPLYPKRDKEIYTQPKNDKPGSLSELAQVVRRQSPRSPAFSLYVFMSCGEG